MKFEELYPVIAEVKHSTRDQCRRLYDAVLEFRATQILELGCAFGKSACTMAAALDELGEGQVTTIDRPHIRRAKPNVFDLLATSRLERWVEVITSPSSYNWILMQMVEQQTTDNLCEPRFDFCFIDGAHSWETDGLAFFLVDKLLKPGGWILFDDIEWSYSKSPTLRETDRVKAMPEDERTTPQIERVFNLLVKQHPGYDSFRREAQWGWARKIAP